MTNIYEIIAKYKKTLEQLETDIQKGNEIYNQIWAIIEDDSEIEKYLSMGENKNIVFKRIIQKSKLLADLYNTLPKCTISGLENPIETSSQQGIQETKKLLTVDEVASYTRLSKSTIYTYVCQRKIPYYKMGSRTFFKPEEIDKWVEDHRQH